MFWPDDINQCLLNYSGSHEDGYPIFYSDLFEFLFLLAACCSIMNSSAKGFRKKLMHLK